MIFVIFVRRSLSEVKPSELLCLVQPKSSRGPAGHLLLSGLPLPLPLREPTLSSVSDLRQTPTISVQWYSPDHSISIYLQNKCTFSKLNNYLLSARDVILTGTELHANLHEMARRNE